MIQLKKKLSSAPNGLQNSELPHLRLLTSGLLEGAQSQHFALECKATPRLNPAPHTSHSPALGISEPAPSHVSH